MPGASRLGDKTNTSVPATTSSLDVNTNGLGALRQTDQFGSPALYALIGNANNVFINSLSAVVIGSLTNIPGTIVAEGSNDVFIGP